jgi:hypothetical protein
VYKHIAVVVLILAGCSLSLQAQCTNSVLTGTYFYLLGGNVGTQAAPYAELGKLVSDGQGHFSGQSTASVNGAFSTYSLSGTYTVQGNCRGSMTLTVNSSGTSTFAFEVVRAGDGILISFSGSGGVAVGQAYRAATSCAKGSFVGSYGFLLTGVSAGLISEEGQVISDGNGNLSLTSTVNSNGTVVQLPGSGTYSLASDCSGTVLVTSPLGNNGYIFAAVQNGQAIIFLSTDAGATVSGSAQSQSVVPSVLPQFVSGGGWYSALYFTNTGNSAVSFPVNLVADDGAPLSVPAVGGSSPIVNLLPHGTAAIQTVNIGSVSQGYASVSLPFGVVGYGVFHLSNPGVPDQEAVVPLSSALSTASTLTWDDTSFVTSVGIVNPSNVANTVSIVLRDAAGNTIGTSSVSLPARNKTAVVLRNLPGLAGMVGKQGSADFTVTTGNVAVLGLRFIGSAFTSIPPVSR